MDRIPLKDLFELASYQWKEDLDSMSKICFFTKSRVSQDREKSFGLSYGMEQPFLLKALAAKIEAKSFFEIGTGRGTACYATSLVDSVQRIDTIDIIPPSHKRREAIGYEPAMVSNLDLHGMIPFEQKNKINFHERHEIYKVISRNEKYDLLFIDGNHTDFHVIYEDFEICRLIASDKAIIVWDDFYPDKFAIKDVVSAVDRKYDYNMKLVECRGHLFSNGKTPEKNCGTVIMSKRGYNEDLFAKG